MYFKKNLLLTAALIAAAALTVITGCGDKPVDSTADTYGLKAVSLGSSSLFKGDVTQVPGYYQPVPAAAVPLAKTAAGQALISFDKAYAMVTQSLNYDDMCLYYTDFYEAFKDIDSPDQNIWEEVLAGCRKLNFYDVVSVSELDKNGSDVEGVIYVKPGFNMVAVFFVNAKGEIIWTNSNEYVNLDGVDSDWLEHHYWYEAGWYSEWIGENATEFLRNYSSGYYYVPNIGEIGISQEYVDDICAAPVITLLTPANDTTGIDPGYTVELSWESSKSMYMYTLYFGTENPPAYYREVYNTYDFISVQSGQTYYWYVSGTDYYGNTGTSPIYSFTTQ